MKTALKSLACIVAAVASLGAMAQGPYPSRPIKMVIPFPPGGAVDVLVRTIGPQLSAELGQPIVVDNRPGGGAQIGASSVLNAPADGYSVFVAEIGAFAINPSLYKNLSYQPTRDFEGVAMLVRTPMVMYSGKAGKFHGVSALKDALASGRELSYGSFGPGTAPHILGHLLSRSVPGAKLLHVPYKGAPPAFQAIMANEIDLLFDGVPGTLNMVRNGKAVPLAVAAPQRSEFLPQVPTTTEIGFPAMQMDLWIGATVKKGTPPDIVNRLHAAIEKALSLPDIWKKLSDLGYSRTPMAPAQFNAFVESESHRYRPIIQETGVVVD